MKKISSFLFVLACIQFLSPSCSKKSSSASTCKIVTIVETDPGISGTTTTNVAYDNNGRVSTIQSSDGNTTTNKIYTYSGSTILLSTAGTTLSTDSITINSAGYMVSDLEKSGPSQELITYTYGSGNQIQRSIIQVNGGAPDTTYFTYTNGDLTSISADGYITTLTYNTSKASSPGDYLSILQLVDYGAPYIYSAHQLAGYSAGGGSTSYSYTTDNTGKITSMTSTSAAGSGTLVYTYQCN